MNWHLTFLPLRNSDSLSLNFPKSLNGNFFDFLQNIM